MAALYVQVGTEQRVWCPDQPDPIPNPNPNPNLGHKPSGGSRLARGWQGQSCHTYVAAKMCVHI